MMAVLSGLLLFNCHTEDKSMIKEKTDVKTVHPAWIKDAVIYEVNLRQYSEEGTFNAFSEHLPRLKALGVDLIWLMPIHPIGVVNRKGPLGSYYSVKDYFAINPDLGTEEDFRNLVNQIHDLDMHIIIDWVANHTSWDNTFTKSHPEWYTKSKDGKFVPPVSDWTDVIDLDYSHEALQDTMILALKYWVQQFDIDGYRCDIAEMVPLTFWEKARTELDKIKPVFMLAEGEKPELYSAFDMTYDWDTYHLLNDIYAGKKSVKDINTLFTKENKHYPPDAIRMKFTTNHDENSWNGTVFERLGDAVETFAVYTMTIPGMPLIYSGQEAGLDKRLDFFSKDVIDWKEHRFIDIYSKFINLKHQHKALWNGAAGGKMTVLNTTDNKNIFAFLRKKEEDEVVCFFNFSAKNRQFNLLKSGINNTYTSIDSDKIIQLNDTYSIDIKPWSYLVLTN